MTSFIVFQSISRLKQRKGTEDNRWEERGKENFKYSKQCKHNFLSYSIQCDQVLEWIAVHSVFFVFPHSFSPLFWQAAWFKWILSLCLRTTLFSINQFLVLFWRAQTLYLSLQGPSNHRNSYPVQPVLPQNHFWEPDELGPTFSLTDDSI